MRKIVPVILIITMLPLVLSGCGKYSKGDRLVAEAAELYDAGDYSGAVETLNEAMERGLKSVGEDTLYFYLGESYFKLGEYQKSIDCHVKVTAVRENAFKSWVTIGVCYSMLDDNNAALAAYSKALEFDPQNSDSVGLYISLGALYIENNKPYTAIDYLTAASEIYPEHPAAHAYLAIAYAMTYEYAISADELELARTLGYENIDGIEEQIAKVKETQGS